MNLDFNSKIRQVLMLTVLFALAILLLSELYPFFPGFLGAITLYIFCRDNYVFLVTEKKWNRSLAAFTFMILFLLCIGIPIYLAAELLSSRITMLVHNQQEVVSSLKTISVKIKEWTGQEVLTDANIVWIQKQITGFIPLFLNSSAMILGNLLMMLFVAYFMFISGVIIEKTLLTIIPLQNKNIHMLASQTKSMIKASAIGIPMISIIQGLVALIGYWIFGVKDYVLWGFLTGIFAFFPVIGTMAVWVPLVLYTFSTGHTSQGIWLTIYSIVVIGNVDYLARITILRKIGDVHPVTTVLGVIVGLQLFGFWGFIFGPLLISYFMLMFNIYYNEFGSLKEKAG